MAAIAEIPHPTHAAQALPGVTTMDSSSNSSGTSSSDDSATISANDFLTLLVTEMQNQDPTADTDPNEYINQLVNVNSLEQLIDINQTLSTAMGSSGSSPTGGVAQAGAVPQIATVHPAAPLAHAPAAPPRAQAVDRNLSAPAFNAAAQRIAHALDGRR